MSKTFKALQRAAKERASRLKQSQEAPDQPEVKNSSTPSAGAARIIALEKAKEPSPPVSPPPPEAATIDPGRPRGEMDSSLHAILEEALSPLCPDLVIGSDGWLCGELDRETCRELLAKYALLHCLVKDARNTYWFWASRQESAEMADRSGLELDPF